MLIDCLHLESFFVYINYSDLTQQRSMLRMYYTYSRTGSLFIIIIIIFLMVKGGGIIFRCEPQITFLSLYNNFEI